MKVMNLFACSYFQPIQGPKGLQGDPGTPVSLLHLLFLFAIDVVVVVMVMLLIGIIIMLEFASDIDVAHWIGSSVDLVNKGTFF